MTHHESRHLDDVEYLEAGARGAFEHNGWFYKTRLEHGRFALYRQRLVQVHPYEKLGPLEGPAYVRARADEWVLIDDNDDIVGRGTTWQDAVRAWR